MRQAMPKSKVCFTCGIDNSIGLNLNFYFEDDKVIADFILGKIYGISEVVVHPGIITAILIEAMGWVPSYILKNPNIPAEFNIRASTPIPVDSRLTVIAEPISVNRWVSEVQAIIKDDKGRIYYRAKGKYITVDSLDDTVVDHYTSAPDFFLSDR